MIESGMQAHSARGARRSTFAGPRHTWFVAILVVFGSVWAAAVGSLPAAAAHTVARGIADTPASEYAIADQPPYYHELGNELNATWVRIDVHWNVAEPQNDVYDAAYMAKIESAVANAEANGLKVLITVWGVPQWASDRSRWDGLPPPYDNIYKPGVYYSFYPIKDAALDDFAAFATYLATLFAGRVAAYECWNEPNLWVYLYPQKTTADGLFGAHTYLKYLERFSVGVRAGDPAARIVAGATAPLGLNDKLRTSPQRFAAAIAAAGVGDQFDVYSHHPYTVSLRRNLDPGLMPSDPALSVELANISTLLRLFPNKPFYLTEYGYSTSFSTAFISSVSEVQQASYLRKAYRLAARHSQIKMMLWFLRKDWSPKGTEYDSAGVYTGLRRLGGGAKRSWFAFAGGNRISIVAPNQTGGATGVRLKGAYTCAGLGGVKGQPLLIQRRLGDGPWRTVKVVVTGDAGTYSQRVSVTRATRFRVVFSGVCASPARLVRVS